MTNGLYIKYNNNTYTKYTNGSFEINKKTYVCDVDGFVYSLNENKEKYNNPILVYKEQGDNIFMYSDNVLCDSNGYIYDVNEDNERYKVLQPIEYIPFNKQHIKLQVVNDNGELDPNYFITDISNELKIIKNWDCLDVYINQNYTQLTRSLTFTLNHNLKSELKSVVTLVQEGDVLSITLDKTNFNNNEEYFFGDEVKNFIPEIQLDYLPVQNKTEDINIKLEIKGGNKKAFIKSIEQFIVSNTEQLYKNENTITPSLEEIIENEIKNIIANSINEVTDSEVEVTDENINKENLSSNLFEKIPDFLLKQTAEQQVLKFYYENGHFESDEYKSIDEFYDKNNYRVKLNIIKTESQITEYYNYTIDYDYDIVKKVETVKFDNAFTAIIENDELQIKNYGQLFLEGLYTIYRIRIAHTDDYTIYKDCYLVCKSNTNKEIEQSITYSLLTKSRLNKIDDIVEVLEFNCKTSNKRVYIEKYTLAPITVEKQQTYEWLTYEIKNNVVYFKCDNNVFNTTRTALVNVKIGANKYKTYEIRQTGFDDYKIKPEYTYYTLEYNEKIFNIKVDVYGGHQDLIIIGDDCEYKYEIVNRVSHSFYTSFYIKIIPTYNNIHHIKTNVLKFKHSENIDCEEFVEFEQSFNIKSLPYTVICEENIILDGTSTNYTLNVNTYPYQDSAITCKNNSSWLKTKVVNHEITLTYSENKFNDRKAIITLINNEFPHMKKIVNIKQKGAK